MDYSAQLELLRIDYIQFNTNLVIEADLLILEYRFITGLGQCQVMFTDPIMMMYMGPLQGEM
jgi:hypothetical protein